MERLELNRRQFLQLSAAATLVAQHRVHAGSFDANPWQAAGPTTRLDPHLALAWAHQFIDHDLDAWHRSTRLCGLLDRGQLSALHSVLDGAGGIQSMFSDAGDAWVTLNLQPPALMRMLQGGIELFKDHIWGAPWSHPTRAARSMAIQSPAPGQRGGHRSAGASAPWVDGGGQRVLVIDHGFPTHHLHQLQVPFIHRASPWMSPIPRAGASAHSHGAQVTGLLLQGLHGRGPWPARPLALYELPDEILLSMPYAALWPEMVDAVVWALSLRPRANEWVVMLSLISTDADRHPDSFISRCARALTRHAQSQGVRLTWVMAAGNSHADRQNLKLNAEAQAPVTAQWHLPAQNFMPSFLECWHDASMGRPAIQVRPPGGIWSDSMQPMSMATRVHPAYDRVQTVLRLPPTAAWTATQALAPSGEWGLRFVFEKKGALHLHLSMMTSSSQGPLRQARIEAASIPGDALEAPNSISGLVPFMPGVVVAQTLAPSAPAAWVETPTQEQLSPYCGRWPQGEDLGSVRHVGFKVDGSGVRPGALTWSRHGHRIQRVSGTSMAVPLAARWHMGMD